MRAIDDVRHGRIVGDTWHKTARSSIHALRLPKPSWAVDGADLDAALRCGAEWLEIADLDTDRIWRCRLGAFSEYGKRIDYGRGAQVALAWAYGIWLQVRRLSLAFGE